MKLTLIKYDNANCLEATWYEIGIEEYQETFISEDGTEIVETKTRDTETVIKCHAYADVQIDMLRADAKELGTSLDEYEDLIVEVEANIVLPSEEEIQAEIIKNKVAEYKAYLLATDYKMTVDYFATLTKEEQDNLIKLRSEAREYVRANS
jgi:hypothetical protein